MVTDVETETKPAVKEDDKAVKILEEDVNAEGPEAKRAKITAGGGGEEDSQKPERDGKERNIDLQLDLER
ncbi:hypothetical protein LINPERHAP2_LOCUS27506, partial [Linum perenne]